MTQVLNRFAGRRLASHILTLSVLTIGVLALINLPLAEKPRIDLGSVSITTSYDGASAEDVEAHVTSKIEKELLTVSGIKTFKSESGTGFSAIEIEIDPNVSKIDDVYQDLRDAVSRVTDLPAGVTEAPYVRVEKSSNLDFMVVGISGDVPYSKLREQARLLELKLRRVPGVGEVSPIDLRKPEYWIEIEPEQLKRYQLTLNEVAETIKKRNILVTAGTIQTEKGDLELVTSSQTLTPEDLSSVVLKTNPPITLKDVSGTIREGFERSSSRASLNGKLAIGFDLKATEDADVLVTSAAVRNLLDKEEKRLGESYSLEIGFDIANEIQSRFDIVKNNGLVGLALVILILSLCLNPKIAFWVSLSIPFCLLGTMIVLYLTGQILDSYTMAALILIIGIIVDDAVVVSERITARKQEGETSLSAVSNGVKDVFPAITVNILTTIIAFSPILFLPGNNGKMLYVLPLSVSVALAFSFVDALIVVPSHMKLTKPAARKRDWGSVFAPMINLGLTYRKRVLLLSIPTFGMLIFGAYNNLPKVFFPTDGAYIVEVSAQLQGNQDIEQSWQFAKAVDAMLKETDEVANWYGEVSKTSASWSISLTPAGQRDRTAEDIVTQWQEISGSFPGILELEFDVDNGGPPLGRPVDLQVIGGDDRARKKAAEQVKDWLENFPGVKDPHLSRADRVSQLKLHVNYELLSQNGVSLEDLANTIRIAIEGERVSRIFDGNEEVSFRLLLEGDDRSPKELKNLFVTNATGQLVSIGDLVHWKQTDREEVVEHFNGERSIRVSSQIDKNMTDPVAVEDALFNTLVGKIDPSVSVVSVGQARETKEAMQGLILAMAVAVIAIGMIMAILFDKLGDALLGLTIVPFGVGFTLLTLWMHGKPLSFFAAVGIIGMIGIAVNNALVLLHHYQSIDFDANPEVRRNQIMKGAFSRVRPMFVTTATTVAGLLPLAYGLGGYDNLISPISLVIGWGILLTAPCVLIIIPAGYSLLLDFRLSKRL